MSGDVIRSVYDNNADALSAITKLHAPGGIQCDVTYGNGGFWKDRTPPEYKFDIQPLHPGVVKADSRNLPMEDGTLTSLVFDPPFITYVKQGREHDKKCVMSSRFGGYYTYSELEEHYESSLEEFRRVLQMRGVVVFKCQDIIHNHKMHCTHALVIKLAKRHGFRLLDLFVLAAKSRMPSPQKGTQRHARIFHSYFLVFTKVA